MLPVAEERESQDLPEVSGIEATRRIKRHPPGIKVLVLTPATMPGTAVRCSVLVLTALQACFDGVQPSTDVTDFTTPGSPWCTVNDKERT